MSDAGEPKPIDFGALLAKAQENRKRLDACPRHYFPGPVPGIEEGVGAMLGRKMVCTRCNGMMDLVALNFYVRGYEAHGGNGNDILPGWRNDDGKQRRFFGQDVQDPE